MQSTLGSNEPKIISNHGFIDIDYNCKIAKNKANCINRHVGYFLADMTCGSQLVFVYIDIIEQQNVGDLQAPFIKVIQSERRILEKGSVIYFLRNLKYKPIQINKFPNFQNELSNKAQSRIRNKTFKIVPFTGPGKLMVNLKFKKLEKII